MAIQNVLVVDDEPLIRKFLVETLRRMGFAVQDAPDGAQALRKIKSETFDLVFADINMPVMSGIEMIDKMSEDGLLKTIPVIIVSTEGSTTRIEHLKSKGISAYVRKPFTPEKIREVVDDILGGRNED